jgi:hypothetical protein
MVAEGMCTNDAVQGKLEGPPKITNAQMQSEIRRPVIVVRAGWELVLKWQGSYRSCRLEGSTCPLWLGSAYDCVSRLEKKNLEETVWLQIKTSMNPVLQATWRIRLACATPL